MTKKGGAILTGGVVLMYLLFLSRSREYFLDRNNVEDYIVNAAFSSSPSPSASPITSPGVLHSPTHSPLDLVQQSTPSPSIQEEKIRSTTWSNTSTATTSSRPLIYLGAGPGTTGTHAIFQAFCHLGIPSVHFGMLCCKRSNTTQAFCQEGADKKDAVVNQIMELHTMVVKSWKQIIFDKRTRNSCQQMAHSLQNIMTHTRQMIHLVLDHQLLFSWHDTPYPYLIDFFNQTAHEYYSGTNDDSLVSTGSSPIKRHHPSMAVLMSERNVQEWLPKRMQHWYAPVMLTSTVDVASKQDQVLLPIESPETINNLLSWYHHVHLRMERNETCFNLIVNQEFVDDPDETLVQRIHNATFIEHAKHGYLAHQNKVRELYEPVFRVNLWTDYVGKVPIEKLASDVAQATFVTNSTPYTLSLGSRSPLIGRSWQSRQRR